MSLVTYEEARPWARSIKQRVAQREMPPWYVERNIGIQTFEDDPSLTDEEIATIVQWVDGGTLRGNPADMPPPRQFADADLWQLGDPDLLIHLPEPVIVPAAAPDWWLTVETEPVALSEDRYIMAVESKPALPGAEKVVHHAVTSMIFPDDERGFLNEYAVGSRSISSPSSRSPETCSPMPRSTSESPPPSTGTIARTARGASSPRSSWWRTWSTASRRPRRCGWA